MNGTSSMRFSRTGRSAPARSLAGRASATPFLGLLLALAGCDVGTGSDIGPRFQPLPNASCKAVVLDDQGRGVVSATVAFVDRAGSARTGRNGRGDLLAAPRTRERTAVTASDAAAVAGDRLGGYVVSLAFAGNDLPAVLHVPDLPDAAAATLIVGTQATTTTVTSSGGAVLTIGSGSSVGTADAATQIVVRLGELQPQHLPGELPTVAGQALLFTRGLLVAPADATFTAAASLDLPDDLLLGTGAPRLYRLDPVDGEWSEVAATTAASGGRLTAAAAVATGGLYAFATTVAATVVSGRVLDAATPAQPVPGALVIVDQHKVVTGTDGRFSVAAAPAQRGDGSGRSVVVEVFAGGNRLPVRTTAAVAAALGSTDVGDVVLDTVPAGNVRVQQIVRGRGDALQPARLSSQSGNVALVATSDAIGQAIFEDVPTGFFGYQTARGVDTQRLYYGQTNNFFDPGRRWFDAPQFLQQRSWYLGGRRARAYVSDALGGGPIRGAFVVQGRVAGEGLVGETFDGGSVFAARDVAGRVTASHRSARDGRSIVHAFTIEEPQGEHFELPLQRVLRTPVGRFDRHGLVDGTLTNVDGTRQHALRATRRLDLQEWWSELVDGEQAQAALPLDVDPATTHAAFTSGLPTAGGHLAAIEFTVAGGARTVQKVGLLQDLVPDEGARLVRDLPLDFAATGTFDVADALLGLAPEIVVADLRFALALRQRSGRVVDVARDLANVAANGTSLRFALPELTGPLADAHWLAMVGSTTTGGGVTSSQQSLLTLPTTVTTVRLPQFPTLLAPAPSATVAATGFPVQWTLPPGARYATIELRSELAGDTLLWQVVVPPTASRFDFVALPAPAPPATPVPTPLVAGRTYTLTLSAWFGDGQLAASSIPYHDATTFLQSLGAAGVGITQVARRAITVTAN